MKSADPIINAEELILVTGAAGFIGARVAHRLLELGFRNLRCLIRVSSDCRKLVAMRDDYAGRARIEILKGNLLSREDCLRAAKGVAVVYHLAAGRGEKLVADAFMNSVVTTRNLLEACHQQGGVRRFVNVSSFSVYSNRQKPRGRLLDESCPIEVHPELRGDAYTFAKVRQDEMVSKLAGELAVPYVIVLAGVKAGVDGEVFNVVDDDLPTSRSFLRLYKKNVRRFKSIYIPHAISYLLCLFWEKYSAWSEGQLPPVYGRLAWHVYWKKTRFTNEKLKARLGWRPPVPPVEALTRHFESCKQRARHA